MQIRTQIDQHSQGVCEQKSICNDYNFITFFQFAIDRVAESSDENT